MQEPIGYISHGSDPPIELIAETWLVQHVARLVSATERIADALGVLAGKVRRETLHEYERAVQERDQQQEAIVLLHGSWPILEAELEQAKEAVARIQRAHPWLKSVQGGATDDDNEE